MDEEKKKTPDSPPRIERHISGERKSVEAVGTTGTTDTKDATQDRSTPTLEVTETRRARAKRKLKKLIFWLALFGVIFLLISLFQKQIVALIKMNKVTWAMYSHIAEQIEGKTLLGLWYAGFFGALFFIIVPLEPIYFYYLSLDHSPFWVITLMQLSSVLGLTVDYIIGAALGENVIARFARERFNRLHLTMERWGGMLITISNIIPFMPVQIISLLVGSTRYGLRKFFVYTFIGRLFYLLILFWGAYYITTNVMPYLRSVF